MLGSVGIMATDGGPHPPEKWARVTASQIIDIAASAPEALLREARAFEEKVVGILEGHHGLVQVHERTSLETQGTERLADPINTEGHVPDAVDDIIAAAKGTSFEAHFNLPQRQEPQLDNEGNQVRDVDGNPMIVTVPSTREYLEQLLHQHFHHSMHIERSWHADANPDHPHSIAFKAVQADGHALLTQSEDPHEDKGGRDIVHQMVLSQVPHLKPDRGPDSGPKSKSDLEP